MVNYYAIRSRQRWQKDACGGETSCVVRREADRGAERQQTTVATTLAACGGGGGCQFTHRDGHRFIRGLVQLFLVIDHPLRLRLPLLQQEENASLS